MKSKPLPKSLCNPIKLPAPPEQYWSFLYDSNCKVDFRQNERRVDEYKKLISKQIIEEQQKKLNLLFKHFEINQHAPNKWETLALVLANRYIDGFQIIIGKTLGRKKEWGPRQLAKLYFDVEQICNDMRKRKVTASIKAACSILAKKSPWKDKKISSKTLANMYQQAANHPLVHSLLDARLAGADISHFLK